LIVVIIARVFFYHAANSDRVAHVSVKSRGFDNDPGACFGFGGRGYVYRFGTIIITERRALVLSDTDNDDIDLDTFTDLGIKPGASRRQGIRIETRSGIGAPPLDILCRTIISATS